MMLALSLNLMSLYRLHKQVSFEIIVFSYQQVHFNLLASLLHPKSRPEKTYSSALKSRYSVWYLRQPSKHLQFLLNSYWTTSFGNHSTENTIALHLIKTNFPNSIRYYAFKLITIFMQYKLKSFPVIYILLEPHLLKFCEL